MALAAPLQHKAAIGVAFIAVGLVVVLLGALAHRKHDTKKPIALKDE